MQKLNSVIAIEQGVKSKGNEVKSELYKTAQKPVLFDGFVKRYSPKNDDGEKFPDEKKKVQHTAKQLVNDVADTLRRLFDVEATKDYANCTAKADIVVDGKTLVKDVPTTFLLYLEKELKDLYTFVGALPTLADDEEWAMDTVLGIARTAPVQTIKTKKVQKPLVMYHATPEHPAQTQLIVEDEIVGYWEHVKQSGAAQIAEKKALLAKVQKLNDAVKTAREQANMVDAKEQDAGTVLIGWLFEGQN